MHRVKLKSIVNPEDQQQPPDEKADTSLVSWDQETEAPHNNIHHNFKTVKATNSEQRYLSHTWTHFFILTIFLKLN